jgi:hypothetical protein
MVNGFDNRRHRYLLLLLLLATFAGGAGCAEPGGTDGNGNVNDGVCVPLGDDDGDGIRNDHEGCGEGTDSDGDGIPDYQDTDSDNDGVPDEVEGGGGALDTAPPDFDGDGVADFRDGDSDNDGVGDGDEDRNGDGLLGQCVGLCEYGVTECGPAQTCQADGTCYPAVTFLCADGETDRLDPDTDDDGLGDALEGTHVCNTPSESNPLGRKGLQVVPLDHVVLAVEPQADVRRATIVNLGGEDCDNGVDDDGDGLADCEDEECGDTDRCGGALVAFDVPDGDGPMAGFAVVRRPGHATPTSEAAAIIEELEVLFAAGTLVAQSAGVAQTTHDGFSTVANVTLGLSQMVDMTASELRNAVAQRILGRSPAEVGNLPDPARPGLGDVEADYRITLAVQHRVDTDGEPLLVVVGGMGVAAVAMDNARMTGIRLDDVSTGEIVGAPDERPTTACELRLLDPKPSADIIWVIDDSASMLEERIRVANGAITFFDHALASGYDFRMGVVNVAYNGGGVLCTDQGESGDFFLTDQHVPQFQACVVEPAGAGSPAIAAEYGITQGYEAIVTHLPRANAPDRIRPNAQLVLIYLSDQRAYELTWTCQLEGYTDYEDIDPACLQQVIGPTVDLLTGAGEPGGRGTAYAIVAPVPWSCPTAMESGQGYVEIVEATGGFTDTICAADLDPALERIAADIIRRADPTVLAHLPIPSTLLVAIDGVVLPRSRVAGFDYRAADNSLAFVNQDFDPEANAEAVISYQRWTADNAQPQ